MQINTTPAFTTNPSLLRQNSPARSGKVQVLIGETEAVEKRLQETNPQADPVGVLRLSTNTYETDKNFALFAPSKNKPFERALYNHTAVDDIIPNGIMGPDAGYLCPLKPGSTLAFVVTGKDTEKLLNETIGEKEWEGVVSNPVHLTQKVTNLLEQQGFKDSTGTRVEVQEVEALASPASAIKPALVGQRAGRELNPSAKGLVGAKLNQLG
jgi:hypothetical protein